MISNPFHTTILTDALVKRGFQPSSSNIFCFPRGTCFQIKIDRKHYPFNRKPHSPINKVRILGETPSGRQIDWGLSLEDALDILESSCKGVFTQWGAVYRKKRTNPHSEENITDLLESRGFSYLQRSGFWERNRYLIDILEEELVLFHDDASTGISWTLPLSEAVEILDRSTNIIDGI